MAEPARAVRGAARGQRDAQRVLFRFSGYVRVQLERVQRNGVECGRVERREPGGDVRAAGSWLLYALRPHKDFLSLRTLAARGRAKPTGLLKSVCDLPDGVVFKCLEFKFGTAGVRVPSLEQLPVLSDPPDIMEAIHTLAETLQISNGEAIELIMREEANLPDYGP